MFYVTFTLIIPAGLILHRKPGINVVVLRGFTELRGASKPSVYAFGPLSDNIRVQIAGSIYSTFHRGPDQLNRTR